VIDPSVTDENRLVLELSSLARLPATEHAALGGRR
jgi:hypothetical protein